MLKDIHSPSDIRGYTPETRVALAEELRSVIIETVSRNGGHLASNLGAVEMTIALHSVFEAPEDKLVFDVGHQTYAHKLLTGRYVQFASLRQRGGLGGFLRPDESRFDACISGHASSGISTALGMARARDLMGGTHSVVAVLGDGALTGGMCYEALNDAGETKTPLIVVLNDNEMSIARNVGALSSHLMRLRHSSSYLGIKNALNTGLGQSKSRLGARTFRLLKRLRDTAKALLVGGQFFEALGFDYIGPIDGHNTEQMIVAFGRAKAARAPVVVHVVTQKGHGYHYAEQHPAVYHGTPPFFIDTGKATGENIKSNGEVMAKELCQMASLDARVCAVTAAMPGGTGLSLFQAQCPDRCFDVGIAEAHAVSMAAGLALAGMRPYVAIYSTFLQRAYDQLLEDVCLGGAAVTLLIDRAGLVGSDGATHQGVFDIAFLRQLPGMVIASPRDARDLKRLMQLSLQTDGPFVIRYARDAIDMGPNLQEKAPLRVGEWELIVSGGDAIVLAVGRMVETALTASIELHAMGLSVGVVDARFVKPMDDQLLKQCADETRLIVTLEEGVLAGGFGEGVERKLRRWHSRVDVLSLGVPDRFIEQGTVAEQWADCALDAPSVARAIRERLKAGAHGE